MAGFFEEVRKVGKTPQQIAAEQSAKVAPVADNGLNGYVKNQVQDIYGRSPASLRASFQAGNQVAPIGQVAAPVNNPAQVVAPVTASTSVSTPATTPVRKAAPSPAAATSLRAPGAAEKTGYVTDGSFPPKTAEDIAMDTYNASKSPAVPSIAVAPVGQPTATNATVSSVYNGDTNADGTLKAKTFTTPDNPAAGLGKFEGGDEVMLIDGQQKSFTGGRVTREYDPATGKVTITPIGGIQTRDTTLTEENNIYDDTGKRRFVAEGKINAEAAKNIAIGQNQTSSALYTDAELKAGKPAAAVGLIKGETSRANADAFKTTVEGRQVKDGEGPKGKDAKLLQESQKVYEVAQKSYLETVKDDMTEGLTPEKKLAGAELYAKRKQLEYVKQHNQMLLEKKKAAGK